MLIIKNVQETDAGGYTCQINTNPVVKKTAYIHIKGMFLSNLGYSTKDKCPSLPASLMPVLSRNYLRLVLILAIGITSK